MLGGAFGLIASLALPEYASHHSVYAIVGMGAVAGAVLGAPISTILIVFELTANFDLTIAVHDRHRPGVAHHQSCHREIVFSGGTWSVAMSISPVARSRALMHDTRVSKIIDKEPPTLAPNADKTGNPGGAGNLAEG